MPKNKSSSEKYLEKARELLRSEAEAIATLPDKVDQNFKEIVEVLFNTKGKVIVTGVGKSGHIGCKIAATFASTGTPSFFMHAYEAGHGDLGVISPDDTLLLLPGAAYLSPSVFHAFWQDGCRLLSVWHPSPGWIH